VELLKTAKTFLNTTHKISPEQKHISYPVNIPLVRNPFKNEMISLSYHIITVTK